MGAQRSRRVSRVEWIMFMFRRNGVGCISKCMCVVRYVVMGDVGLIVWRREGKRR